MSGQTQALIGLVICILALAAMHVLHYYRDKTLAKRIDGLIEAARGAANKVVDHRKEELDKQEREIHEEMGRLNRILLSTATLLMEFMQDIEDALSPLSSVEDDYEYPAPRHRYPAGGGGAEGGASTQDDLPDAQGEAGGAG